MTEGRERAVTRVAMTGATGFIGSAVLEAVKGLRDGFGDTGGIGDFGDFGRGFGRGVEVRALAREVPDVGGPSWVRGDLADEEALAELCDGADVLLHLASLVSGTTEECEAVNVRGTGAVMAAARRAGVGRIVHLSTSAVYGRGPHAGIGVDEVPAVPASEASRTRLLGERAALAAGAVVLRPGVVTGPGDRWVVPAVAELVRRVPVRWEGGEARLSLDDRAVLARLVVA
ncbi:NAD-dependent epimerase/dehydratase family protein, partial [Kitasatospora sp. NPDC093558]|uniref:NAD-dependent epimerase/dehydratase family protein n=1 Tax=Kitasatospora sp. NPDC093558 TaxID=3155201 RepID=UPI0034210EEB